MGEKMLEYIKVLKTFGVTFKTEKGEVEFYQNGLVLFSAEYDTNRLFTDKEMLRVFKERIFFDLEYVEYLNNTGECSGILGHIKEIFEIYNKLLKI